MRLNVEVDDIDGGLLDQISDRTEHPEPGLLAAGDAFRTREARAFATAAGGSWAPDDPGTVRRKGSARVLVDTGGLLRSLTSRGDRYHLERVTPTGLLIGTRNPVANLHRRGARGMPKRDPVPPTTPTEREQFAAGLLDFLIEGDA